MRNTQECGYASPVWHWWVPEQLLTSRGRVGEHVLNMRLEPANARWALLDGHQSAASEAAPQMNPFRRPGRMPCVTCTPHPSQQQCECGGNLKWKPPPPKLTPLMQLYKTRTRHLTRTAFMLVDLPHDLVAHVTCRTIAVNFEPHERALVTTDIFMQLRNVGIPIGSNAEKYPWGCIPSRSPPQGVLLHGAGVSSP
jgi:hypothetical protein